MINIFLKNDTFDLFREMTFKTNKVPWQNVTIDIIDIIITGTVTVEKDELNIQVFSRDEMKTQSEMLRTAKIKKDEIIDVETTDPTIVYMYVIARKTLQYLDSINYLDKVMKLDEKTSGIELKNNNNQLSVEIVSGKKRPDLLCTTLFNGAQMCRPYDDEFMEKYIQELISQDNEK